MSVLQTDRPARVFNHFGTLCSRVAGFLDRHVSLRSIFIVTAAVLVLLLAALAVFGANDSEASVTVVTNEPLTAFYIERFNQASSRVTAFVEYSEEPLSMLESEPSSADIVIGRGLTEARADGLFARIDDTADRSDIYSALLSSTRVGGAQRLIPLSYDIPAVMLGREPDENPHGATIELSELRTLAAEHNERSDTRFTRMGFSPLWNEEFLYTTAQIFGARFRHGPGGRILWSSNALEETVEFLQEWSREHNEGFEAEEEFRERYLNQPPENLVAEGRIRFWPTSGAEFFSKPDAERERLEIRWLAHEGSIPVSESMVSAGIPRQADEPEAARELLQWLLTPEVQGELMAEADQQNEPAFGFFDGFSSVREVNRRIIPSHRPQLVGQKPGFAQLQPPDTLPDNWNRLRSSVVTPWIADIVRGRDGRSLRERIRRFAAEQAE